MSFAALVVLRAEKYETDADLASSITELQLLRNSVALAKRRLEEAPGDLFDLDMAVPLSHLEAVLEGLEAFKDLVTRLYLTAMLNRANAARDDLRAPAWSECFGSDGGFPRSGNPAVVVRVNASEVGRYSYCYIGPRFGVADEFSN